MIFETNVTFFSVKQMQSFDQSIIDIDHALGSLFAGCADYAQIYTGEMSWFSLLQ